MTIIERTLWTIGIASLLFIVFRQRVTIARLRRQRDTWQLRAASPSPGRIKIKSEDPR